MHIPLRIACLGLVLALLSCGGGGSGGGGILIDFEDRPDDGFTPFYDAPLVIAPGVTVTNVDPDSSLADFSTADGWGLFCGSTEAFSGTMMMGVTGLAGVVEITFDSPVSAVQVYANGSDGTLVELEAFDALGASLGLLDSEISDCPSLRADDLLQVGAGSNVIKSVEIRGNDFVFDDLTYFD